jgi:hypothetical protein
MNPFRVTLAHPGLMESSPLSRPSRSPTPHLTSDLPAGRRRRQMQMLAWGIIFGDAPTVRCISTCITGPE